MVVFNIFVRVRWMSVGNFFLIKLCGVCRKFSKISFFGRIGGSYYVVDRIK